MTPSPITRLLAVTALALLLTAARTPAQPPVSPPPPKDYRVELRYQLYAPRDVRLRLFPQMVSSLRRAGLDIEPGEEDEAEDPNATRLYGTIRVSSVRNREEMIDKLFGDPHVKSVLLIPADYNVPSNRQAPVHVDLQLASGMALDAQRLLADQTRARLVPFGFREAVGYDNRAHTRLVGTIPAGQLGTLLKDLRGEPSGWLAPAVPVQNLPQPLRSVSPVVATIVTPEPAGVRPARQVSEPRPPAPEQAYLLKIAPELRDLAARERRAQPVRMQVILNHTPAFDDAAWRQALTRAARGGVIEGRIGQIVTILALPRDAERIAQVPVVSVVRLPWPAATSLRAADTVRRDPGAAQLDRSLDALNRQGKNGRNVRVAVIDGDFRGYDQLVKSGRLPARTRYVDLTAERNPNVEPDPFPSRPGTVGHGAQCALALAMAAPEAELTLIRIDPASPQQFEEAARVIDGGVTYSEALALRRAQLREERRDLDDRLQRLQEERKEVQGLFVDPRERQILEKRPESELTPDERERLELLRRQEAYERRQKEYGRDEQAHDVRLRRYTDLLAALQGLQGIQVVSSSLVWNDGYPLGGASPLSRYFDSQARRALWFQAAGDTRGQVWTGLFRDHDGNGVMEFTAVRPDRPETWWRDELNFLAWQPFGGAVTPTLPGRARVRLSIQWREVHDPDFPQRGEDLYLRPLAQFRLVVLRQRDPSAKLLPTDDFEVVARSQGLPQRLDNQPDSAVYEQAVEFTVDPAGHYALRVEGYAPTGTRPPETPRLGGTELTWELRPRIFVDVVDRASRLAGRPVFESWPTDAGTIGVPADAHQVIAVGAADFAGQPEPSSAAGPPAGMALLVKPDVLAYNRVLLNVRTPDLAYGTGLAAPFAAGLAAVQIGSGVRAADLAVGIQRRPGQLMPVK